MAHQIYYHILGNPLGCSIAKDQIGKINRLIPGAKIHCGVIESDREAVLELRGHLGRIANVEIVASAAAGNEWTTLTELHGDCRKRWPARQTILYCHTKGAYSTHFHPDIVPAWREWMEYFLFFRHQDALEKLGRGYTAYGFDAWRTPRRAVMLRLGFRPCFRFFSGNYWWSTAGAIRRISLQGIPMDQRHSAEGDFLSRIPRIRTFDAVQLVGLPSILAGAYTNYNDNFRHFPRLMEKAAVLDDMRAELRRDA